MKDKVSLAIMVYVLVLPIITATLLLGMWLQEIDLP